LATFAVPRPPEWVLALPIVGSHIASGWQQVAAATPEELAARVAPYARTTAVWFVGQAGSLGFLLDPLVLTGVVVAMMYSNGETVARGADRFARRLAGPEGEKAIDLAARAVRAVALGVVVTAILQTALVAVGLAVAGVPFVSILVVLVFVLSV